MKIIIDGDACPSISKIENLAKEYAIEVNIFVDIHHYIQSDYSKVIVVDSGFQSVDMYVVNNSKINDIVVTQDYGLAAMVLAKLGYPINQNGNLFTSENINQLLFTRHLSKKARSTGLRMKGPKKRQKKDDIRFQESLRGLISSLKK